jgi:hypothetical protein
MKRVYILTFVGMAVLAILPMTGQLPVPVTEPLPQTTITTNTTETTLPDLREFYYSQAKQQFRWVVGDWRRTLTVEEFNEAAIAKNVDVVQLGVELGKIIDYIREQDAAASVTPTPTP